MYDAEYMNVTPHKHSEDIVSGFETPEFKVVTPAPLHAVQTQGCSIKPCGVTVQFQGNILNHVQKQHSHK